MRKLTTLFDGIAASFFCQLLVPICVGLVGLLVPPILGGILFWGLLQWILVIPLIMALRKEGKTQVIKGVSIMSSAGVVLNAVALFVAFIAFRNLWH